MTTIVANRSRMAADSKVTAGESHHYRAGKIVRVGEAVVGCAGHNRAIFAFLRWLERGGGRKPRRYKGDDFEALVLTPKTLAVVDKDYDFDEIKDPFYAIGSGSLAALGALHCGVTLERAVEIACLVDSSSGLPVDVMEL